MISYLDECWRMSGAPIPAASATSNQMANECPQEFLRSPCRPALRRHAGNAVDPFEAYRGDGSL